jgi:FkbM family methyltransferase
MKAVLDNINSSDVVVDCGAHVGDVTRVFARTGAQVVAIEPHTGAVSALRARTHKFENVRVLQGAATPQGKAVVRLYRHKFDGDGSLKYATGSSLRSDKPNVSEDYM